MKLPPRSDHLSADNPVRQPYPSMDHADRHGQMFELQSKTIIGLERLMLEASSFDFRNRNPQALIVKLAKSHGYEKHSAMVQTAHAISLDLYRTFAPLKQGTATLAFACLELSARLHGEQKEELHSAQEYRRWGIDRPHVMGTQAHKPPPSLHLRYLSLHRTSNKIRPNKSIMISINIIHPLRARTQTDPSCHPRNPPRPPRPLHPIPHLDHRRPRIHHRNLSRSPHPP